MNTLVIKFIIIAVPWSVDDGYGSPPSTARNPAYK